MRTARDRRPRGIAVVVALVVAAVVAAGMVRGLTATIDDVATVDLAGSLDAAGSGPQNWLLVGSDSRAGADPDDPDFGAMGSEGDVSGRRSDTMMLLRLDPGGKAALLSLPRDLWVTIAGTQRSQRLNAAYAKGPATLVATVRENLGVPVHRYVEVGFVGFKDLVDALGGVEVCFDHPARDANSGLDIPEAGCRTLDGVASLALVRSRFYEELRDGRWRRDPTGDIGRIARQQGFVRAVAVRAVEQGARRPLAAGAAVAALADTLEADDGLGRAGLVRAMRAAPALAGSGFETFVIPADGRTIDGNAVLVMREAEAAPILGRFGA